MLYLDADPYPKLKTEARLQKAVAHLSKYRELAVAAGGADADVQVGDDVARVKKRSKRKGKKLSAKERKQRAVKRIGKELVSVGQADLYIELARKGLDPLKEALWARVESDREA